MKQTSLVSLNRFATWMTVLLLSLLASHASVTLEELHSFPIPGKNPYAALIQASDGNFYGTTYNGGPSAGTVFRISPAGTLTNLFSFAFTNGANPAASLIQAADGDFYGTTENGGEFNKGTVFKLTPSGAFVTLISFAGTNGAKPYAALIQGTNGNFYGTTYEGGQYNSGTIFQLTPAGELTTLFSFESYNTGAKPYAGLIQGTDGNLYGTTSEGGELGQGAIFRITLDGTFTNLVSFYPDQGSMPYASLIQGTNGSFYGTTSTGGEFNKGTVFQVTTNGELTVLASFATTNGANPYASLVQGTDGTFYGTTYKGGEADSGTVFQITAQGALTTLVSWNSSNNGAYPRASLMQAADGNFYGTTEQSSPAGYGLVYKMNPAGSVTTFRILDYDITGIHPHATLVQGTNGNFYGTTSIGGTAGIGAVFQITPLGTLTTVASFDYPGGINPETSLILGTNGNFFGTTPYGGSFGAGTVFELTSAGTLNTLVSFDYMNASEPSASLVLGRDGNFYGSTYRGGEVGYGTIFRVTHAGLLTTLAHFAGTNGSFPNTALVQTTNGDFYGTTQYGGDFGAGTVFRMTPTGTLTTLVYFANTNGSLPTASLVLGVDGNFYGTTSRGGKFGNGTVFKMTPAGILTTLVNFTYTDSNGAVPNAALIQATDGNFYGTTTEGGSSFQGTIFRLTPAGTFTSLLSFAGTNGAYPYTSLTQGIDGNLYGSTYNGGSREGGTIFRLILPNTSAPSLVTQPTSRTNYIGTTATFAASATGEAPLSYQWKKSGTNLVDGGNISGATASTLNLGLVTPTDEGTYSLTVSNSAGSITSSNAQLTVISTHPRLISSFTPSQPGQLIFSATNGSPNGRYTLLTTTNIALPITEWLPTSTNYFDANGAFSLTNTINPGEPQRFHLLRLP